MTLSTRFNAKSICSAKLVTKVVNSLARGTRDQLFMMGEPGRNYRPQLVFSRISAISKKDVSNLYDTYSHDVFCLFLLYMRFDMLIQSIRSPCNLPGSVAVFLLTCFSSGVLESATLIHRLQGPISKEAIIRVCTLQGCLGSLGN